MNLVWYVCNLRGFWPVPADFGRMGDGFGMFRPGCVRLFFDAAVVAGLPVLCDLLDSSFRFFFLSVV